MPKRKAKKKVGRKAVKVRSYRPVSKDFTPKVESNLSVRVRILGIIALGILGYIFWQNKGWQTKLSPTPETIKVEVTATPAIEITADTYIVKPGDTLKSIARRAYGDENAWVKIAQTNKLKNPNRIEAGWVLRLPR